MTEEHEKERRERSFLPKDKEAFLKDTQYLFYLNKDQLSLLVDEFQKKHDSFSTAGVAKLLNTRIDIVNSSASIILYLNHMITSHHLPLENIEREFVSLGLEKDSVSFLVSKLRSIDEQTKADMEKIFWSFRYIALEGNLTDVDGSLHYNHIVGEGKFLGLVPTVRLQFEISSNLGEKKEFFSISGTLDDLSILIKRLQEAYESAMLDVKRLKQEFKERIICVPKDD